VVVVLSFVVTVVVVVGAGVSVGVVVDSLVSFVLSLGTLVYGLDCLGTFGFVSLFSLDSLVSFDSSLSFGFLFSFNYEEGFGALNLWGAGVYSLSIFELKSEMQCFKVTISEFLVFSDSSRTSILVTKGLSLSSIKVSKFSIIYYV